MGRFYSVARDSAGNAIAEPTVTVYEAGTSTPAATFHPVTGLAQSHPFTGNADGSFGFRAVDGLYRIVISKAGYATRDTDNVVVNDGVPPHRAINTVSPLTGGGNLSADRTLALDATYWQRGAMVRAPVGVTVATATNHIVDWTGSNVPFNYGSAWNAGTPTRLTAPVSGVYAVTVGIHWASTAGGIRRVRINFSGGGFLGADIRECTAAIPDLVMFSQCLAGFTAGQYVEVEVRQTTGGNLAIQANNQSFFGLALIFRT